MGFEINQTLPSKKSFHCAGVELDFKLIRVRPAFATFAFLKNIDQMLFKPLRFKRIRNKWIEAELISLGVQFYQYSLHLFTFLMPSDFWLFMTKILLQKSPSIR